MKIKVKQQQIKVEGKHKLNRVPKQFLIATRLMNFLSLLEAKLTPSQVKPSLSAVQRRAHGNGLVESRSILSPREKGWVPCIALAIPVNGEWVTLFLEDNDLEKPPAKLVKECMAIVAKDQHARQYGVVA